MRKYFSILLTLFIALSVSASSDKSLFVVLTNGVKIEFALSDEPELTFVGQTLEIDSKLTFNSYSIDLVKEMYFQKTHVGIEQVLKENDLRVVEQSNESLTIEGLQPNENVNIYTMEGKQIPIQATYSMKKATIDLSNLNRGVYIIRIGKRQTIKITKK